MKLREILNDPVILAFDRFKKNEFSLADRVRIMDFSKIYLPHVQQGTELFLGYKAKLDAKDPETTKQWNEYLDKEVELQKLPYSLFFGIEKMSAEDFIHLEPLFTDRIPEPRQPQARRV